MTDPTPAEAVAAAASSTTSSGRDGGDGGDNRGDDDHDDDDDGSCRRVYVGNLQWRVGWQDLKDLCRSHLPSHDVVRVDVLKNRNGDGRSRGCAIIEFATPDGAQAAIQCLHHTELNGRQIFVREDREGTRTTTATATNGAVQYHPPSTLTASSSSTSPSSTRVYVGNLSYTVGWQDLKEHMSQAGRVVRADVMTVVHGNRNRSKGCGIVEFVTEQEAKNAILTLNDTDLMGRKIFVREDRGQTPGTATTDDAPATTAASSGGGGAAATDNGADKGDVDHDHDDDLSTWSPVYVWNLSSDTTWQQLKDHFARKGLTVIHATIVTGRGNGSGSSSILDRGRSTGAGIVTFATAHDAQRAIQELQESNLNGRNIRIREERTTKHDSNHHVNVRDGSDRDRSNVGEGCNDRDGRSYSGRGPRPAPGTQLFVGNLSFETTWQDLKDHFSSVGIVERANVVTDAHGKSRGFGIVRYLTKEDAMIAVQYLHGVELDGRSLQVRMDHKA